MEEGLVERQTHAWFRRNKRKPRLDSSRGLAPEGFDGFSSQAAKPCAPYVYAPYVYASYLVAMLPASKLPVQV